jgi:hypothetical protein
MLDSLREAEFIHTNDMKEISIEWEPELVIEDCVVPGTVPVLGKDMADNQL